MVRVEVSPSEAEVICSADGKYSLSFNLSVNLPVEGLIDQLLSLSASHQRAGLVAIPTSPDSLYPPIEDPVSLASATVLDPFLQTPFSSLRAEDVAYREYLARGRWPVVGDFFVKSSSSSSSSPKLRTASTASTVFSSVARPPPGLVSHGREGSRPRALSEASCLLLPGGDHASFGLHAANVGSSSSAADTRSRALTMNHWAPPCEENSGSEFPQQSASECKQM
jgi:hypothetical protein